MKRAMTLLSSGFIQRANGGMHFVWIALLPIIVSPHGNSSALASGLKRNARPSSGSPRPRKAFRPPTLCRDRTVLAACPAHAVAHLHACGLLARFDYVKHCRGACRQGGQGVPRSAACDGLHSVRPFAAWTGQG